MKDFRHMEGHSVMLWKNGVFHPADVYLRGSHPFAKYGTGYIALLPDGHTSHKTTQWTEATFKADVDRFDRVVVLDPAIPVQDTADEKE